MKVMIERIPRCNAGSTLRPSPLVIRNLHLLVATEADWCIISMGWRVLRKCEGDRCHDQN